MPRVRGAAFTTKIMAKRSNNNAAKARYAKRMEIERLKSMDQVNKYGGLGKVGLDYDQRDKAENLLGEDEEAEEEQDPNAFSSSVQQYLEKTKGNKAAEIIDEDEELLCDNLDDIDVDQIDDKIIEEESSEEDVDPNDLDKAAYKIPKDDDGYRKILKEKFGHDDFLPNQLEAIKIIVEKKDSALVVLATGAGKSLIYQFSSLFMPGLVLVIGPLIALMGDQLSKLPHFLPGAAFNSNLAYKTKQ
jgi:hypothetical protein